MTRTTVTSKIAIAIVAACAWLGLAIQFYVTQTHPNLQHISAFERTVRYFEYFTILTNLMVAVSLSIVLIAPSTTAGRFLSRTCTRTAIAVYIALVGIVYNVILQGLHDFSGLAWTADFLTHDVVPLLYTVYWVVFVPKAGLNWTSPLVWTIYPLLYVSYALIRASSTGRYPYPFLDVAALGFPSVFINTIMLSLVFIVLGGLLVGVAKVTTRLVHPDDTSET